MWAYATNRVHGLGLSSAEFWASTPVELAAHIHVMDQSRLFLVGLYAGLQETLHNAHFRHKSSDPIFRKEMWLPGYKDLPKVDESWKIVKSLIENKPITPEQKHHMAHQNEQFTMRQSRAAAAKARGATRDEVMRIMEGMDG